MLLMVKGQRLFQCKNDRVKGVKQSIRHLTFPLLLLLRTAAEETEMENLHETKASLQHCII